MTDTTPSPLVSHLLRDETMKRRFVGLWRQCLLDDAVDDGDLIWARLERRYREPHRRYHDPNHLAHCLAEFDAARAHIDRPDAVETAIWFHDVINEPRSRDNEQLSADYFRDKASGVMAPAFIDAVVDLILATTHDEPPTEPDRQFICDIDLSSFGCPWECFVRDSARVKAEFPGTDAEYYRGKSAFMQGMLARPRIFLSDFFHDRYERQARENVALLLQDIERQGL